VTGGVKATSFTVDSYTQIAATVPDGAKRGIITVITAGGAPYERRDFHSSLAISGA